jgi:hypothetical protein
MYLFQYGSNMDQNRLEERISDPRMARYLPADLPPRVELRGAACLVGWRFDMLGHNGDDQRVCDIVKVGDTTVVWGALWDLDPFLVVRPDGQRSFFDRIEGYRREKSKPDTYIPLHIEVLFEGQPCHARTYVCSPEARPCSADDCTHVADRKYTKYVRRGAASLCLPEDYQACLRGVCEEALAGTSRGSVPLSPGAWGSGAG